MRDLGPARARLLAAAGIADEAALRAVGTMAAYRRAKDHAPDRVSLNMLYALQAALMDVPWTALSRDLKEALRRAVGR
ncbi:MAG: competence protein TfoX [Alphaproteobacteria bacterium]|nr:competence protein TfoX [Alphaproteobacteria bacterium]